MRQFDMFKAPRQKLACMPYFDRIIFDVVSKHSTQLFVFRDNFARVIKRLPTHHLSKIYTRSKIAVGEKNGILGEWQAWPSLIDRLTHHWTTSNTFKKTVLSSGSMHFRIKDVP
jgi:hypothetical protein